MAAPKSTQQGPIQLQRIGRHSTEIPIVGVSPLIPHRWSEKALRLMREAQSGSKARAKREAKDPTEEAEGAQYYLPGTSQPGMPATAFKAAIVGAVRLFDGLTMTLVKQAVFVQGVGPDQLVAIHGDRELREDTPRNATGVADLRYRYYYGAGAEPWRATLDVTFNPVVIDESSIVALVDAAGDGGVGDWRPSAPKSATGTFGRFRVDDEVA